MNKNRLITYSLLAHINNTGSLVEGLIDIYVPIIKDVLSKMINNGINSGGNISEIQKYCNELHSIDMPIPVLKNILYKIEKEINNGDTKKLIIYKDLAFAINNYVFDEFDNLIEEKRKAINNVEALFKEFCELNNVKKEEYTSIFSFIDKNKTSISKYLNDKHTSTEKNDFSTEAQFVNFFKRIPKIYNFIKDLYLGSILSSYIEFSTKPISSNIELLLDTNFIISVIDLNTPESTHTCLKLLEIAQHNGYKITALSDTIEETQRLLLRRAEHFNESFLARKVNPEDIYNACERRGLTKTDLEQIADKLEEHLSNSFKINIIPHTTKYSSIAKFSSEYSNLQKYRNTKAAALHDATAIYYVREKRGNKRIKDFERVNCWFVNNAFNIEYDEFARNQEIFNVGTQPEIIKVDILLNILWLSNPNIGNKLKSDEIVSVGLPALISSTLNESLPKNSIIRELDDNIHKYAEDKLSDEQIVRVATRIASRQLTNIEHLNRLAGQNKEEFVKRLKEEAEKQKELEDKRIAQIENVVLEIQKDADKYINYKDELNRHKRKEVESENRFRALKRDLIIKDHLYKWRRRSWIELVISLLVMIIGILLLLIYSGWEMSAAYDKLLSLKKNIVISLLFSIAGLFFSMVILTSLYSKYRDQSNIKAYIDMIKIPDEFKDIPNKIS